MQIKLQNKNKKLNKKLNKKCQKKNIYSLEIYFSKKTKNENLSC